LIELDLVLYGLSLVLEFVALLVLRLREPDLARPFRVPGGFAGAAFLGLAPTALIVLALIRSGDGRVGSFNALGFGLFLALTGCAVYMFSHIAHLRARARGASV
jgi:hypothetical protein